MLVQVCFLEVEDIQFLHTDTIQSVARRRRSELATVVAADLVGHLPRRHQLCQTFQHIVMAESSGDIDRQAPFTSNSAQSIGLGQPISTPELGRLIEVSESECVSVVVQS